MKIMCTSNTILTKMIFVKLLSLFLLDICTATYYRELQCNFSVYFLNYFNHNKLYLQELHDNNSKYNELDAKTYGTAIQSHGEIIMVMLDVLRHSNPTNYAKELMSINLYLNNVSNTLDMVGKNDDGTFDRRDNTSSLIKGFVLIHLDIEKQLKDFEKNICVNTTIDRAFVEIPESSKDGDLHPKTLKKITNQLKNRIFNKNPQINQKLMSGNLKNSFILKSMISAINRAKYEEFHPKNLLFYSLMTNQRGFIENGINQARKKPKVKEDGQLEDVLDLLRFAPLKTKCPNKSTLTVFDIFRFAKYSFDRLTVQSFESFVQAASIHPMVTFILFYSVLFRKSIDFYGFNTDHEEVFSFYENMINLGSELATNLQRFIDLKLIGAFPRGNFDRLSSELKQAILWFKKDNEIKFKEKIQYLFKESSFILKMYRLENKFIAVDLKNNNLESYYEKLIDNFNQIKKFTVELVKHKDSFYVVNRTMSTAFFPYHKNFYFLRNDVIEFICKENIYSALNKANLDDSDEDSNDEGNYDSFDLSDIEIELQSVEIQQDKELGSKKDQSDTSKPLSNYMIDYLLFK